MHHHVICREQKVTEIKSKEITHDIFGCKHKDKLNKETV